MKDIWFTSDHHFYHGNILKFTDDAGKRIRPEFSSVEEMNSVMADNWNKVVKPGDHVWHLGDFAMGFKQGCEQLIKRLHGRKRITVGNHDEIKEIAPYFEKVVLWRIFKEFDFTCTHIPLRPGQMRKTRFNVHGHIHQNVLEDPRYINVCVEHTSYTPLHLDEIRAMIKKREDIVREE